MFSLYNRNFITTIKCTLFLRIFITGTRIANWLITAGKSAYCFSRLSHRPKLSCNDVTVVNVILSK